MKTGNKVFIIPPLRHFTILGQKNTQNIPRVHVTKDTRQKMCLVALKVYFDLSLFAALAVFECYHEITADISVRGWYLKNSPGNEVEPVPDDSPGRRYKIIHRLQGIQVFIIWILKVLVL